MADVPVLKHSTTIATSSHRYASPSEWEPFRPLIKRLYVDEEKSLKEVMTIMARDHGHHATAKMYKSRIKKWNLDKKTKEAEAWALLRMKKHRDAAGKDSAFRVRGKTRTVEDALRYFKRKGILDPDVEARPPEASTPQAIECWTPLLSPKPNFATIQAPEEEGAQMRSDLLEFLDADMSIVSYTSALDSTQANQDTHQYLNIGQARQIIFSSPGIQSFEIPYSPLPPQSLLVSEKLFASIKAYYSGAFDSGLFKTDDGGYLVNVNERDDDLVFEFDELCSAGTYFMSSKSFAEGRRCFSKASSLAGHLHRRQHPRTLELMLDSLIWLTKADYVKIARILTNLMHGMANMLFAEEHPWRQVFSQIGNLDDSQFELALVEGWRCICNIFTDFLGQFHRATVYCYTTFMRLADSSEAVRKLYSLLIRGEQELDKFDANLLNIRFAYGAALYVHGRIAEAIAVQEKNLTCLLEVNGLDHLVIDTLEAISFLHYSIGHELEAESTLQDAIKKSEVLYGKFYANTFRLKACLEAWLIRWGREVEAAELRAEIDNLIGPDDIELEGSNLGDF